jgi:hypothetical protein
MKKVLIIVLLVVLTSSMVFADSQIGDKINDVLHTDIVTEINGQEVESFNINGSTAIYVTPLQTIGATVNWNGENRRLNIFNINIVENNTSPKISAPGANNGSSDYSSIYSYVKFGFNVNYANGVELRWIAQNLTGKTINYYTANVAMYNPVGDPAYDTVTGEHKLKVKYVGPSEPNDPLLITEIIGYTAICDKIVIESIDVEYSDGTSENIPYGYSTTLEIK